MASNVYGGPDPAAAGKVATPALVMQILAGLSILVCIGAIIFNVLGMAGVAGLGGGDDRFRGMFSGGISLVSNFLSILFNAFILFGAQKMKNLESYALAMVAVILMMLPCNCCCFVNVPVGIWGLITLLDANVKAAFRS
jgi:hypothetical protein